LIYHIPIDFELEELFLEKCLLYNKNHVLFIVNNNLDLFLYIFNVYMIGWLFNKLCWYSGCFSIDDVPYKLVEVYMLLIQLIHTKLLVIWNTNPGGSIKKLKYCNFNQWLCLIILIGIPRLVIPSILILFQILVFEIAPCHSYQRYYPSMNPSQSIINFQLNSNVPIKT
jgi:hypothetical protein